MEAAASPNLKGYFDSTIGQTVVAAYKVNSEGQLIELSLDEYAREVEPQLDFSPLSEFSNSALNNNTITPFAYNYKYYTFIPNGSSSTYYKSPVKVSNPVLCPSNATTDCPITVGWTTTTTHEFSANVTLSTQEDAIQTALGYTYSSSTSFAITYTLPIPKGRQGYVGFRPRVKTHYGKLNHYHQIGSNTKLLSSTSSSATYPLKNSDGTTDGIFVVVDNSTGQIMN